VRGLGRSGYAGAVPQLVDVLLFDHPTAPSPRRVRMFCAEKRIELPRRTVELARGEHHAASFVARNPDATVPVLQLADGRCLTDSYGICSYLEARFPDPPLMGSDPADIGIVATWERKIEREGYQQVATWLRHGHPRFRGRAIPGVRDGFAQVPEICGHAVRVLDRLLEHVDRALARTSFVAGPRLTVADIGLLVTLDFAARVGMPTRPPSAVAAWHRAMAARPSASA
jgi:glutathione S-transferase